ncbi:MAG: acyltransferase family protein [Proteobacteria bacterium]|nr:MAG: acyltransferase family protein [Pseudomonadota bacterium]
MKSFFEGKGAKKEIPLFLLEIIRKYFRLEVVGTENLPKKGRFLVVPNHSGVTALDAMMVGNEILRAIKVVPRILAHPLWFVGPNIRILAKRMGLEEADKGAGQRLLKEGHCVMIFPEGAAGNFKPTAERYHLQEFRRGFVRMAMATKAPIVPVVVIGAEETNINLSSISLTKMLKGTIIPIPLNVLPLPAKWKIIFLPKISMSKYSAKDAANSELVHKIAEDVRQLIQARINEELEKREFIYFPPATTRKRAAKAGVEKKKRAPKVQKL